MARTPRKRQPAATTVVVPRNAGTGRRPRAEWTEEEEAYAQRLIDDFRNGRTPSLRNGSYLSGHLAGILGRPASTIRLHFGALGKRGFRKLLTPTPAEAQEVADLRRAFLAARAARARDGRDEPSAPCWPPPDGPDPGPKGRRVARGEGVSQRQRRGLESRRGRRGGASAVARRPTREAPRAPGPRAPADACGVPATRGPGLRRDARACNEAAEGRTRR